MQRSVGIERLELYEAKFSKMEDKMNEVKILVIDDEEAICDACSQIFTKDGYLVETCLEGTSGLKKLEKFKPHVVFVDLRMPGLNGMDVLDRIRERNSAVVPIVITGYGTIESAVESMKKGAFDFLCKPLTVEKLRDATKKALEKKNIKYDPERLIRTQDLARGETTFHVADLVAFVKPPDLPPSLYPFAKSTDWEVNTNGEGDVRLLILKIRGTIDSYHAIVVRKDVTIEDIEEKIHKELEIVRLSQNTRDKLEELLGRFQNGKFTYYVKQRFDSAESTRQY
jgi:FixJ family two-component response regulator